MEVLLVDAGLGLAAIGFLSLLWPLRFLRIRTRRRAALVAVCGLLLVVLGCLLPVRPLRLPGPAMELDRLLPRYQFGEHHEIRIEAPPERVYSSVRTVTARDIPFFLSLTWIRSPRFQGGGPETILSPRAERPILDVALGSTFVLLHEAPGREIVVGTIVCCGPRRPARTAEEFWAAKGSVARAVMSFHLAPVGDATRLVTQTRVHASDAAAQRRFAAYWRVIYPGSAFIRVMWLRAIRHEAEAPIRVQALPPSPGPRFVTLPLIKPVVPAPPRTRGGASALSLSQSRTSYFRARERAAPDRPRRACR